MNKLFALLPLLGCVDKDASDDSGGDALVLSEGFGLETLSGTAQGAEEVTSCDGWYPSAPQHLMTLTSNSIQLFVEADSTDVVLRLTYDASTFCSDNDSGLPRVERGAWSAGDYQIYVGVPEEGGAASDYVLEVVELD